MAGKFLFFHVEANISPNFPGATVTARPGSWHCSRAISAGRTTTSCQVAPSGSFGSGISADALRRCRSDTCSRSNRAIWRAGVLLDGDFSPQSVRLPRFSAMGLPPRFRRRRRGTPEYRRPYIYYYVLLLLSPDWEYYCIYMYYYIYSIIMGFNSLEFNS